MNINYVCWCDVFIIIFHYVMSLLLYLIVMDVMSLCLFLGIWYDFFILCFIFLHFMANLVNSSFFNGSNSQTLANFGDTEFLMATKHALRVTLKVRIVRIIVAFGLLPLFLLSDWQFGHFLSTGNRQLLKIWLILILLPLLLVHFLLTFFLVLVSILRRAVLRSRLSLAVLILQKTLLGSQQLRLLPLRLLLMSKQLLLLFLCLLRLSCHLFLALLQLFL